MKSKDLQNIVLSKYRKDEIPTTEIHRALNGGISLATIKRWCQMIRQSGSIQLLDACDGPRIVTTKENIQKVKNRLRQKQKVSARKLSRELGISAISVRRILKIDLGLKPYKTTIEPSLPDRVHRVQEFGTRIRTRTRCIRIGRTGPGSGPAESKLLIKTE